MSAPHIIEPDATMHVYETITLRSLPSLRIFPVWHYAIRLHLALSGRRN